MWFRPIDAAQERRRLASGWQGQSDPTQIEKRYPVQDYPMITRTAEGGTHYVKLPSMTEEKRFRNWNSALRFFEDNAMPSDRAQCARQVRALRRGSHSQVAPARVLRRKASPSPPPPPPAEPPEPSPEASPEPSPEPPPEAPPEDDDVDFGSLETLLGEMDTEMDTEVPLEPFDIPEGPVFSAEELELLRTNECANMAGYRGVKRYRSQSAKDRYPFYSTVMYEGVRYTLGSHSTAEEAALHAAKAREGLQAETGPYRYFERWGKSETKRLVEAVRTHGCETATPGRDKWKWEAVAKHVGTRTARQCHRRWEAVNPNATERQLAARRRRHERDAVNALERKRAKQQARMGVTDEWIAEAAAEGVDEAPFAELEDINGTFLRADETLGPSDDFVDARRQRVRPIRVFTFTPFNKKAFHYGSGPWLPAPPPPSLPSPPSLPPLPSPLPAPPPASKITDYLLVRKNKRVEMAVKEQPSKPNAQRVLELAAAL